MRKQYGRLTIKYEIAPPKEIKYSKDIGKWFLCECECGNLIPVPLCSLKSGNTSSCGCYRKEVSAMQVKLNQITMREKGRTTKPTSKEILLEHDGKNKNISEWAKDIGISKQALQKRLKNEWPLEKALAMKGDSVNENQTTERN